MDDNLVFWRREDGLYGMGWAIPKVPDDVRMRIGEWEPSLNAATQKAFETRNHRLCDACAGKHCEGECAELCNNTFDHVCNLAALAVRMYFQAAVAMFGEVPPKTLNEIHIGTSAYDECPEDGKRVFFRMDFGNLQVGEWGDQWGERKWTRVLSVKDYLKGRFAQDLQKVHDRKDCLFVCGGDLLLKPVFDNIQQGMYDEQILFTALAERSWWRQRETQQMHNEAWVIIPPRHNKYKQRQKHNTAYWFATLGGYHPVELDGSAEFTIGATCANR